MADNKVITALQKFFKIGVKNTNSLDAIPSDKIFPLSYKKDVEGKKVLNKEKFDEESQKLYDWWLKSTHDSTESWKQRSALWDDMDMLYFNAPLISRAIELIADEVIQADSNDQPIFIEAKRNVKKFIQEFFDEIGLYNYLRATVVDIIQYGNAGWLLGFDQKGVTEIIPMEIYSIKDRLEFSPYEVKQKQMNKDRFLMNYMQLDRIQSLITSILDKEESTSYYKKYLFGFQLEDRVVPPWKFLHFRNPTNKSPFRPFGVPMFIHAMSAYRQYDAAMTLQQVARMNRFPKNVLSVNLPNVVNPTDKMEKAIEVMNEWTNVGFGSSKKELPGIGDWLIIPKDVLEFSQITPDIDLGNIDDINLLRDEIVIATQLPRFIIDSRDSGFGDTGVALVQKWKPFARLVYRVQSILLENITQLVKIHMIYSQQFQLEDIDFTLSMKFPESQTSPDIVTSQSSLLDLANNIIGAIQDKITGGEQLPPELVKDIYTQFLPYDSDKIGRWVDDAVKSKEQGDTSETLDSVSREVGMENLKHPENDPKYNLNSVDKKSIPNNFNQAQQQQMEEQKKTHYSKKLEEAFVASETWRMLEKTCGRKNIKEAVSEIIFEEKQKVIKEAHIRSSHVYSSKHRYGFDSDFQAEKLIEFDKKRIQKLKEDENDVSLKEYLKEEVKYVFEPGLPVDTEDTEINVEDEKNDENEE